MMLWFPILVGKLQTWTEATQKALEEFMKAGGGFVSVHAADNSFPTWLEYNKMIGLGGWGDRNGERRAVRLLYQRRRIGS